jgi:glycine/D-amino acid oxidase-like deaminating enzyme
MWYSFCRFSVCQYQFFIMNLSAGYPLDLIRSGIPYDYPKLDVNAKAEVVIMGGGISGALVAFYLVKAGVECMLVDGRTIGFGSTCASTSLLQYEIDKPLSALSKQIGDYNAQRAYHLCGKAINDLEKITREVHHPGFQFCNSIYFAALKKDKAFLKEEFEARKHAGFDVKWMEASELKSSYGLVSHGAIISSLAAQTNVYTLTHDLLQYCIKKGMTVYDRTKIRKINHHRKGVSLTTEEDHMISCGKLVYATGYESVKYINKKIVQLSSTYATAGEQFADGDLVVNESLLFWNTADPYLYTKFTDDKRVIAGGRDEAFTSTLKTDALIKKKSYLLARDLQHYFPTLPFKKEFSWTGIFGSTKDGLPFVGRYNALPNGFFALGFGGNGITFSVVAAQLILDMISGRKNADLDLFSFERA